MYVSTLAFFATVPALLVMLIAGQTMITTPVILHLKTAQHIMRKTAQQRGHSMKTGAATLLALTLKVRLRGPLQHSVLLLTSS